MAKNDSYQGALDSIFGFIFANNKSDSKPLKPPKPTGASGANSLAAALGEIATKPAAYMSEEVLGRISDTLDADIARIKLDSNSEAEFRIRTKDLGKIITDPNAYFNKAIRDEMKKTDMPLMKLITGGKLLDQAVGYGVAKYRLGVDNKTASRMGMYAGRREKMNNVGGMRRDGWKMFAENTVMGFVGKGITQTQAQRIMDEIDKTQVARFDEESLGKILDRVGVGAAKPNIISHYKDDFMKLGTTRDSSGKVRGDSSYFSDGRLNHVGYGQIFRENLRRKGDIATGTTKASLRKTQALVEGWMRLNENFDGKKMPDFDKTIKTLDRQIGQLAGSTTREDINARRALILQRNQLDEVSKKLKERNEFWNGAGKLSTPWKLPNDSGFNNPKLLRRGFIAELESRKTKLERLIRIADDKGDTRRRDHFIELYRETEFQQQGIVKSPISSFEKFQGRFDQYTGYLKMLGSGEFNKFASSGLIFVADDTLNPGGPGIFRPGKLQYRRSDGRYETKNTFIVTPRTDINPLFARLTALYYITPGSLAKTFLFNGEYFAFRAHMVKDLFEKNNSALMRTLMKDPAFSGFFDQGNKQIKEERFLEFLNELEANPALSAGLGLGKLRGLYNRNSRLFNMFSIPFRFKAKLQEKLFNEIKTKTMGFVTSRMGNWFRDVAWKEAVEKFGAGAIGLRQLIQTGLASLGTAFGGPLGTALSWVVTEAILNILPSILSGIAKGLVLLLWGIIFLFIGLIVVISNFGNAINTTTWAHIPPQENIILADDNPFAPVFQDFIGDIEFSSNAPPGSTCPFDDAITCNQGAFSTKHPSSTINPSHSRSAAIDVSAGTWYAPGPGGRVTYASDSVGSFGGVSYRCSDGSDSGGMVIYEDSEGNQYLLLHVSPIAGIGPVGNRQAVARMDIETNTSLSKCTSGAHYHLEVISGGSKVEPEQWYRDGLKCTFSNSCPTIITTN